MVTPKKAKKKNRFVYEGCHPSDDGKTMFCKLRKDLRTGVSAPPRMKEWFSWPIRPRSRKTKTPRVGR